jgi:hypothetical protein
MKLFIWFLLLVGIRATAQYSTVQATITDSDGQTWNNGTVQVTFVPPTGYQGTIYTFNGTAWTPGVHNYTLSPIGVLNATLIERNDYISPSGSHWQFKICPNASVNCTSVTVASITQATQDITSQLNLQTIRFQSSPTASRSYGYGDVEVSPVPSPGGNYFNVNLNAPRVWNGSQWNTMGAGGGSATPSPPAGSVQIANSTALAMDSDPSITIDKTAHAINVGTLPTNYVEIGALGTPTAWKFDTTSPATALASLGGGKILTTITTATTAIAASVCDSSATTVSIPAVTTGSVFAFTPSVDISGVAGWGAGFVYFVAWPTAGNLNYKRCNGSSTSVTPGAVTWNVSVQ